MKLTKLILLSAIFALFCFNVQSHQNKSSAHYIANEGVMISHEEIKILFDPFFHNSYGHYTLVPNNIRHAIFNNLPPYDNVKALFISHAHKDHFDEQDVLKYLNTNQSVKLFAPTQAVQLLKKLNGFEKVTNQVIPIDLKKGESEKSISIENIDIEAVRIPHAGWPQRAEVENIVFRVKIKQQMVVMHMGDADPNKAHYQEHSNFWPKVKTDVTFPPYWFALSKTGQTILQEIINTKKIIGIHVPTIVPKELKSSGYDYFSKPGEKREFKVL